MTIALVTGGCGFIGRKTLAALRSRGIEAVAADVAAHPDEPAFHELDVSDAAAVSRVIGEVRPDVVVHLAALLGIDTDEHPRRGVEINVMGAQFVFDAAVEAGVKRVVYGSSIAVYGDQPAWGEQTVTEADLGFPTILYGWHKQLNEATARHYQRLFGLRSVGLRISTVYGEGRTRGMSAPLNRLIEGAASGVGECPFGEQADSCLIHVEDVAEILAILATAEDPQHDLYNAGGDFSTIGELAGWIKEFRPDAQITLGPPDVRIPHVSRVDGSRLIGEFGFTPRSFEAWTKKILAGNVAAPPAAG
jgi:nucleoside-diphosphate-sugar epimerase